MRPIDADATLDLLKSLGSRDYRRSKGTIAEAEKMLMHEEYTPTIDAEPVRHGHWRKEPFLMGTTRRCNLCGENYGMPHGIFNYCPNCGAKMDEEANDAEA